MSDELHETIRKQQAKILWFSDKAKRAWDVAIGWQRECTAQPTKETLERATNALLEATRASRRVSAEMEKAVLK